MHQKASFFRIMSMTHKNKQLFSTHLPPEMSDRLLSKIIGRIKEERRNLSIKQRLIIFSIGLTFSSLAFMPTFRLVQNDLQISAFGQFLSLLISDGATMLIYWKNFSMTLLESLPVMSLAIFVAVIYIFVQSLKYLTLDIKNIYQPINN